MCLIFLSHLLFVHRIHQVNNKDTVHVRDHSVFVPCLWEATLQCKTISHWSGAYTECSLQVQSWWCFLWEKYWWIPRITSLGYQCIGPELQGFACVFVVNLIKQWIGQKNYWHWCLCDEWAMMVIQIWMGMEMYIYIFTDFIMYHITKIRCIHWAFNTQCLDLWGLSQGM